MKEVFHLCVQGYGVSQIANEMSKRHVLNPTAYAKANGRSISDNRNDTDDYTWISSTVSHMLSRPKYLGHTVNFKTYRKKGKEVCPSHQTRNSVIETLLLDGIRSVTAFAREHEDEFVEMVTKKKWAEVDRSLRDGKRELEQAQTRVRKLDEIIQHLYEDNLEGKISDERFMKLSENYENEQKTLESRVAELKSLIASEQEANINVDRFLGLVRKYTDIKELNAEIIKEFVERIYVHQTERINGRKIQIIRIVWNCIGEFTPPVPEQEKETA